MQAQPVESKLMRAIWALNVAGRRPEDFHAPQEMRLRVSSLDKLPPLPEISHRILALRNDPYADARKLARIVELDPSLAAQIVRWACSPLYGAGSNKNMTVKDAIVVALGYDKSFDLAFALSTLSPLRAPVEGPLGKRFFWRQTLAGGLLIQQLARRLPPERRPNPGELQLLYLLHNTGHLLLAHLFRREFEHLVNIIQANPGAPLFPLERFALDVDHCQLGAWLMQAWEMPDYLRVVIQHHHNPRYRGEHERLVWLACLTDRLLGEIGIGDARNIREDKSALLENLGLEEAAVAVDLQALREMVKQLDGVVAGLL